MNDLQTYKINGRRIAARTDAQARFAKAAIERHAREARRTVREVKRIALDGRMVPGFKQKITATR